MTNRANGNMVGHLKKGGTKKRELFKTEDVPMRWNKIRPVGAGFSNLGNTCFMNSVLQCLLHTAPLAELLLSGTQLTASSQSTNGFDPIAITRQLLLDSLRQRNYVSPLLHARTLKRVCRSFRIGRQEDAHEYLIALLDAMHERSIAGLQPKPSSDMELTSFVYRIFGGRIRSQVKCSQCGYESNTYDPFLDLSLEINHAHTIEKALKLFTAVEVLDGGNKYKCPRQNKAVRAEKRMTIESSPNVLVLQLKRFEFSFSGRKVSKPVAFSEALDLSPYLSTKPHEPVVYDLYGVLVHQGHSMHSGHYYCFVKSSGGSEWHKFDDTRVHATAIRNVMGQLPYILFYIKRQSAASRSPSIAPPKPELERPIVPDMKFKRNDEGGVDAISRQNANAKRKTIDGVREKSANHLKDANGSNSNDPQKPETIKKSRGEKPPSTGQTQHFANSSDGVKEAENVKIGNNSNDQEDARDVNDAAGRRFRFAPLGFSPISSRLGRRVKRLNEQKLLISMNLMAKSGNQQMVKTYSKTPKKIPAAVSKAAAVDLIDREQSSHGHVASGPIPDHTQVNGIGSRKKSSESLKPTSKQPQNKAEGKNVEEFLRKGDISYLQTWEGTGAEEKLLHDRLLQHGVHRRKRIDEYDEEYDQGKVKKVRVKATPGSNLNSKVFDKLQKSRQSGNLGMNVRHKKKTMRTPR